MKKRLLCLGLLLAMVFSFGACGSQEDNSAKNPAPENPIFDEQAIEEFIENFDRQNSEFDDKTVLVLLTEKASFEHIFHDYTAEDFPLIGAVSVSSLDGPWGDVPGKVEKIRQYLSEDPSGNTIPDNLKHFKRSFCITLDKEDEKNVLRAVYILRLMDDIYSADPNWIGHFDI